MNVLSLYKPFRDLVATLGREDALRTVWAYSNYLQLDEFSFPSDVEVGGPFLAAPEPRIFVGEWELELIAKEVIINGVPSSPTANNLRSWSVLARVLNDLKALENVIYAEGSSRDALLELNRIAHRQFIWQANPLNASALMRYFRIFDVPQIDEMCRTQIGMSVRKVYLCGMSFMGHFLTSPTLLLPYQSQIAELSEGDLANFLAFCSRSIDSLKQILISEQIYDDRFVYAFNSLRTFPLVGMDWFGKPAIVCPILTHLFWRITGGLYYLLCKNSRFGDAFGHSFQNYVGEVVSRALTRHTASLLSEKKYGSKAYVRDSVDWIVIDEDFALFLECKAKRVSWDAKMALGDLSPLKEDMSQLAAAVVQTYKAIVDYESNQYPHFPYDEAREVLPVVVTLENWFMFGPRSREMLKEAISSQMQQASLPATLLLQRPYSVVSIAEMEIGLQYANVVGLRNFWRGKLDDSEMSEWAWFSYQQHKFGEAIDVQFLFEAEYDNLFPDSDSLPD